MGTRRRRDRGNEWASSPDARFVEAEIARCAGIVRREGPAESYELACGPYAFVGRVIENFDSGVMTK